MPHLVVLPVVTVERDEAMQAVHPCRRPSFQVRRHGSALSDGERKEERHGSHDRAHGHNLRDFKKAFACDYHIITKKHRDGHLPLVL